MKIASAIGQLCRSLRLVDSFLRMVLFRGIGSVLPMLTTN